MDLHDFDAVSLYFDEPCTPEVAALLDQAAGGYTAGDCELPLLRAHLLAPGQLSVLVGLYRFYFYQHRHADADLIATRAMSAAAQRLALPDAWWDVREPLLADAALRSIGLLRFWLMALKARAVLALRAGHLIVGRRMLEKLIELDECDRLGVRSLLELVAASGEGCPESTFPPPVIPAAADCRPSRREP